MDGFDWAIAVICVLLAAVIGFSVWFFGFDNSGCPAGTSPVGNGTYTYVMVGKVLTPIENYDCVPNS